METSEHGGSEVSASGDAIDESGSISIELTAQESLNAVSCDVERQYLERLYKRHGGDLGKVAEQLLGDANGGRKVQLRMNQLGIKLRELKQRKG